MKHIPNLITCLNLAAGFAAIIFTSMGNFAAASWLILAAMVFDFLDGFAARLLNAYSDMGKELDSLADVVSFGVAPAFMIYTQISSNLTGSETTAYIRFLLLAAPFLMPVCAALRLAKFNNDTTQTTSFKGLPTPASALAVITIFIGGIVSKNEFIIGELNNPLALGLFTLVLSLFMVSRVPLFSLKTKDLRFSGNEERYVLIIAAATLLLVFGLAASALIIPLYIVISLGGLLVRR
jgi:CDP-diacylglycerol---serine O-phosphatidyltransferase